MKKMQCEEKKIYIFCYADYMSGGPEALHQLRYYMELQGIDAWIVYIDKWTKEATVPERYLKYFPNECKFIGEKDYKDCSNHLIIMPENCTRRLFHYKKSKMAIWWLSVGAYDNARVYLDNYQYHNSFEKNLCKIKFRFENMKRSAQARYLFKSRNIKHYCASQYAYDYVNQNYTRPEFLVEPISKEFLDSKGIMVWNAEMSDREKKVLYNPKKPSALMSALLQRNKFSYSPITGYTPDGLIELYRKNRLYIDFGDFPGPERIPKETVYNGCNILVGKRNAAENNFDVAIPEKYKMVNPSVEEVESMIGEMLEKYEEQFPDFDYFRKKVDLLEEKFTKAIQVIWADYIMG